MFDYTATYTDYYQLTMAQVYYYSGQKENRAVFDYFFRKLPFEGGYAVFAGLEDLLDTLQDFRFNERDLEFLKANGFRDEFIRYLAGFRFTGNIRASYEGDLIFPVRPVVQVEANIIEAQIIETLLLNILNFQTLIATKASRMRLAAGERKLVDFGLRRAQGPGGYYAARAAFLGGFDATSNVRAGRDYGIQVSGTMAHSFIENYEDELTAFSIYAEEHPDNCVLLVDTYNTLRSGLPNAVRTAKILEEKGYRLNSIRLDSGDLAYLARKSRELLDKAGLNYVRIAASNQLDEHIIKSLLDQHAPIDIFGVGTSLVTGRPDGALDGVYKLAFSNGLPRIKLSENPGKTTLPHRKQVYRILEEDNSFAGAEVVTMIGEQAPETMYHPFYPDRSFSLQNTGNEPLLHEMMVNGTRLSPTLSLHEIASFSREQLKRLPSEYKRFHNPHVYKIGLSSRLRSERDRLTEEFKK